MSQKQLSFYGSFHDSPNELVADHSFTVTSISLYVFHLSLTWRHHLVGSQPCEARRLGTISSSCFYWLRQIRRIRRSLDAESAKTLVHAFITSRIDGCNTVLAGTPRTINDRLQRLLNVAARVVSNTGKFDRGLTHLLFSELHWLDVPQRILHKLGVTVHRCLQGKAPQYLVNCCHPTSDVASRQRLRSSSRHHLVVP